MSTNVSINDLTSIEASTTQLPLVGYSVFWRVHGIRVKHHELEHALDAAGLKDFLPDPPTPRKALRRALEAWIAAKEREAYLHPTPNRTNDPDEKKRTLIRVINRAGNENLVFALVAEDIDYRALGLSYATDLRILLHKKTGAMVCTTNATGAIDAFSESQQVASELQPYWREFKELHIAGDLSEMVREIIDSLEATSLRRAGGVYFVPASKREGLGRLRGLIVRLPRGGGQEPFICALGIPDAQETKRHLVQAVHAGMLDEIAGMQADLNRLSQGSENMREGMVGQRLAVYQQVKAKAQIYADLLGMRQETIRSAVSRLETQARNLLLQGCAMAGTKEAEDHHPDLPFSPVAVDTPELELV